MLFRSDLTNLNSKIEGVQIALYEKFQPALRKSVAVLSSMADGMAWLGLLNTVRK